MVSSGAKAILLLLLVALPCAAYPQSPYSDAAFRTFISVSVNNSTVWAKVTFLNITYFSQVNGSALAEIYRRANASQDLGELYRTGNYSTENFTAEVDPVNGSLLRFTFEGGNITNGAGTEICNPVKTDEHGIASCEILHFKDALGQEKSVEEYRSCGYVDVHADELALGGERLQSASQTAVVCPAGSPALSALGPAIYSEVGSRLPVCFPAMLIVGLLIAAMYYSGRDPLSLFDITTPKLPKTQSFKVKMETSPQMLRQVQRRYIMIKGQARRDSVREVARMARAAGKTESEVRESKRKMGKFYDELESNVKKGMKGDDELVMRQRWAKIMDEYKGSGGNRVERSLAFSSGLLEAYLKAHQSWQSMNAARNKTSKGWWAKNVSDRVVSNLTRASVAIDDSKTGKVLGKIPFVRKVISAPTKILDVSSQLRGSRNALKGARAEFFGQAAYMLGRTKAGKPIYNAARALHIGKDGKETGFAKAYGRFSGRSFKAFEDKHDLSKKRLVEYYKVVNSVGQHLADSHNAMFDEISKMLIAATPLRANAVKQAVEAMAGLSKAEREGLMRTASLDELFGRMRTGLLKTEEGKKVVRELAGLMGADFSKMGEAEMKRAMKTLDTLGKTGGGLSGSEKENIKMLSQLVSKSLLYEGKLRSVTGSGMSQSDMLAAMAKFAVEGLSPGKAKEAGLYYEGVISEFRKAERALQENMLVFLDKDLKSRSMNYYRIIDKDQLKSDIAEGMPLDRLRKKYGAQLDRLVENPELYRKAIAGEGPVKGAEDKVFARFAAAEAKMKDWILQGGERALFKSYQDIASRVAGCMFGKNPLGDAINSALKKLGISDAFLFDKDGKNVFTGMDALEQFLNRKAMGGGYTQEFGAELERLSALKGKRITHEDVLKAIMPSVLDAARDWSAKHYATIEIMHGGSRAGAYMASSRAALKDLEAFGKVKSNLAYLGGEKAFYRWEMGYSERKSVDTDALVFTARGWEKLFGFVVADRWVGTSRGEQVLHLLSSARADYTSTLERYKVLYANLINEKSVFYDEKFAGGKAAAFDSKAYEALLARGYTWQDKKNGLELLISVDRKSTPMLEYDPKFFGKYTDKDGKEIGNRTGIVLKAEYTPDRKADIRDYAPLVARTMGSNYSTREIGFIVLTRQGDKWIYGDPFKKEGVMGEYGKADKQATMRADIMKAMVGIKDGKYDVNSAPIRVISVKDFVTYAKDKNYQNVFGNTGSLDRFREGMRSSTVYKPSMLAAEFFYGAYTDKMNRMNQWYAGQYQLRQALDRLHHTMQDGGGWMGGKERFKYDGGYVETHYANASSEVREKVGGEMRKLAHGESGSALEDARAWGREWRSRIASGIVSEIGSAETSYHNAKLEVRALERLAAQDKSYAPLYKEALARKDEMKSEYKQAKETYGDFNRDVIGWAGSHGWGFTYQPQRTMWTLGLAGRALGSTYVQGTKDAFYQITESSVMRDPRVAIGATSPGWEYSYYVGYNTGQNVYERARYWATNSSWEKQIHMQTNFAYTVHKWWNDKMSFFSRYTSGYPSPVQSDMMYAPEHQNRRPLSYLKTLLVTVPLQGRTYTDYFRSRWQDAISFTGVGAAAAAYQSLGSAGGGDEGRSWLRKFLDSRGQESSHYTGAGGTPFRISSLQRYVDQVMAFDDFVNSKRGRDIEVNVEGERISLDEARDRLKLAAGNMNFTEEETYKKAISDTIGKYVRLDDRRGRFVRDVFSGSDIQEDGSRNRFLDLYSVFHSNIFTPTIPGMLTASPLGTGEWHTFPQVARNVDNAEQGAKIYPTKHYWEAGLDREDGRITFADRFSTREDAVAEAYRNDVPVLMHLMKMQQKDIWYSPLSTPSLFFASPIWMGLGRKLYRTAVTYAPGLESLGSTVERHEMHQFFSFMPGYGAYEKHRLHMDNERRYGHDRAVEMREEQKMQRRQAEDEDSAYKRGIYGGWAGHLAEEGEMSSDYLKATSSVSRGIMGWVNAWRYTASPGWRKISKKTEEDYIAAMLKR